MPDFDRGWRSTGIGLGSMKTVSSWRMVMPKSRDAISNMPAITPSTGKYGRSTSSSRS
jgi:hypothetical protein